MHGQLRIDEMYAYIVLDDDNTEGVPAFSSGAMMIPMVGADMKMANQLRPRAQEIATQLGKKVTLVKFSVREELEVMEPR